MKILDVKKLIETFGPDAKLSEVLVKVQGENTHRCPKCHGSGIVSIEYNAYPKGLPDSDFRTDMQWQDIPCDLCAGVGFTAEKYKAQYKKVFEAYVKESP